MYVYSEELTLYSIRLCVPIVIYDKYCLAVYLYNFKSWEHICKVLLLTQLVYILSIVCPKKFTALNIILRLTKPKVRVCEIILKLSLRVLLEVEML